MKLKSSNIKGLSLVASLLVMVVILFSLKNLNTKNASKYPSTPDFKQTSSLDFIQISLNEKHYKKLKKKRDKALSIGILETSDTDYVPATISFNGKDYRAEIRLKGDWTDHLEGDKWSFRIKLKDDRTILGMRKFSIHHPKTRGNINEWLYHKAIKAEGLVGLRYGFVEGAIHVKKENSSYINKPLGLYAIEETFDKRTIESNKRKESVILKFTEDYWWEEVKKAINTGEASGLKWNKFMNPDKNLVQTLPIATFSEEKVLMDSTMHSYFTLSKNLLEDLRSGKTTIDKVFDVKKLAMQNAILNLFAANHGIYIINLRFYYNPITSKLEPIAFDGNSGTRLQKYAHFLFLDKEKDSLYLKELVRALHKVSQPSYINNLVKDYESDLNYFDGELKREFKGRLYSVDNYRYNQSVMKAEAMRLAEKYNMISELTHNEVPSEALKINIPNIKTWQNKSLLLEKSEAIYKVSRKNNTNGSFLKINDIDAALGRDYLVSFDVKKGDKGDFFGLRIQGVYPNRVDAVFDLKNGKVLGLKKFGTFQNEEATIKPIGNGWYRCTVSSKINILKFNIILGPTDGSKNIANWEGQNETMPSIYLNTETLKIEEKK